ncbi:predicted protein, partial [Nematostella vectensis]
ERKRFYKSAGVEETEGGFQITVDNRKVKTPARNWLVVPNQKLAVAMASEWNMQTGTIKPASMHLTSLANTVIDKPSECSKDQRIEDILEYLYTDTVRFPASDPDDLVELQKTEWGPLISWFSSRFGVSVPSCEGLLATPLEPGDVNKLKYELTSVNHWAMTGLEYAVDTSKSFITSMALLDNHVTVEKAAYLTRLELEFQIGRWGSVEWAHDVDLMELRCRLAAAALFYHLCIRGNS